MIPQKPVTPGVYPTVYNCVLCSREVKKKEAMVTKALLIDEKLCVCGPCLPQWEDKQTRPLRDLVEVGRKKDRFTVRCQAIWEEVKTANQQKAQTVWEEIKTVHQEIKVKKEEKRRRKKFEKEDVTLNDLAALVHASIDDEVMRSQLLGLVNMQDGIRESVIDMLILKLKKNNAPEELVRSLGALKNPRVAEKTRTILR